MSAVKILAIRRIGGDPAAPLPAWARGYASAAPSSVAPTPAPGDALAAQIETRVLAPLEQSIPAAAPLVAAVRRCGGCTHAKHQLGSTTEHPDPGVVL